MKLRFTIIALSLCHMVFSQWVEDSVCFREFEHFIKMTKSLIKQTHKFDSLSASKKKRYSKKDSTNYYAIEVRNAFRRLDTMCLGSWTMAMYFAKGKSYRSNDISSPVIQLQCSYSHYMYTLRNERDSIPIIVNAALVLEMHLKNGYPSSLFCPFIADEVKFGPGFAPTKPPVKKFIIPDSSFKKN